VSVGEHGFLSDVNRKGGQERAGEPDYALLTPAMAEVKLPERPMINVIRKPFDHRAADSRINV